MSKTIVIIRIDPAARSVARMRMECGRDATREVRRVLRAKSGQGIGWHRLIDVEEKRLIKFIPDPADSMLKVKIDAGPTPLVAAGLFQLDPDLPGWRLRGCEGHAGIGILFGKGLGGGMVDVPVDVAWVERRIVWTTAEEGEAGHG